MIDQFVLFSGCARDIFISAETTFKGDTTSATYIKQFLTNLVSSITIGPHDNQVAVSAFDSHLDHKIDLNDHNLGSQLIANINSIDFNRHHSDNSDLSHALSDLKNDIQGKPRARANVTSVVLLIANHKPDRSGTVDSHLLTSVSPNVIVVDIGAGTGTAVPLATDANHVVSVPLYSDLRNALQPVLALLCV